MLSKDGKFVSFLDTKENVTKIYEIGEKGDKCELVGDLGVATSKVDFNFDTDNPVVTFHKFNNLEGGEKYPTVPSEHLVANVYEFNLKTRKIRRLTNNTNANSIYPAFRKDGKIVYLNHPHDATDDNTSPASKLVVIDPKKVPEYSLDLFDNKDKLADATALGALWAQACSPFSGDFNQESAALASFGMDKDTCQKLVGNFWDKFKLDVASNSRLHLDGKVDKDRLLTACSHGEGENFSDNWGNGDGGETTDPGTSSAEVAPIIKKLCLHCHLTEFPWTDKAALNRPEQTARGKAFIDEIIERTGLPRNDEEGLHMPQGTDISPEDKKELDAWIASMRAR
jgi:hypothetical protein